MGRQKEPPNKPLPFFSSFQMSFGQWWGGIPSEHDVPIRPGPAIENSRWCVVQDLPQFLIGDVLPDDFHILMGPVGHGIR